MTKTPSQCSAAEDSDEESEAERLTAESSRQSRRARSGYKEDTTQDNFLEAHEPAELIMCMILAAIYAGLAKYLFVPLQLLNNWRLFINVEGFFITVALILLVIGLRPYVSPASLQLSSKGIKYRGPYWPQRKTVNWDQINRIYAGPEIILILYHPKIDQPGIWPMIIQSGYLSDKNRIEDAVIKYSPMPPTLLANPNWVTRLVVISIFALIVIYVLERMLF